MEVPQDWPSLRIERASGGVAEPLESGTVRVWDDHADVWLYRGDRIDVDREKNTVRFTAREPLSDDAIIHPYLGLPAAIVSCWMGRCAFHGGAFLHRDRAWGLLGDREAGKSATLAQLFNNGLRVISDDVLIVDGTTLLAGPRSIDLRADAAELGGRPLGIVGNRPRWRLRTASGPPSVTLGGFVHLGWGDDTSLKVLDPEARVKGLIKSCALRIPHGAAGALLDLIALPALRFVRPRGLSGLAEQSDQLLAALDERELTQA